MYKNNKQLIDLINSISSMNLSEEIINNALLLCDKSKSLLIKDIKDETKL